MLKTNKGGAIVFNFKFEPKETVDVCVKQLETGYICSDNGKRQAYGSSKQEAIELFKKEFNAEVNVKE